MLVLNAVNLAYICLFLAVSLVKFEHNNFDEFKAGKPARWIKQLLFLVIKVFLTLSTLVYFCFLIGYTVYHQRKKTEVEGVNAVTLILLSLNLQMLFTDLFYSSRIINTLIGLLFSVKGKDTASNPYDKLSEKFDGDPERKLIVGDDTIYSLAYMLCLDRSNLMELIYKNEIEKSKKIHYI